jgi:hypothetical protein
VENTVRIGSMVRALTLIIAAAYGATAQTDAGLELWGRVRQHLSANVAGLPDYTCRETMERSVHDRAGQIEFRERLRLEVLVTEAGELFAWPGSTDFTAQPLGSWIGAGAIGTGNFSTELHNLFVVPSATVTYAGLETLDQRSVQRFDFHAPLLSSRYSLTVHGRSAITAYSGSFWVDRESLDLLRLNKRAEEIPPDLDCIGAEESVTYGRVRLGVSERLLPSGAELALVSSDGRKSSNTIAFSQCRHYTAGTSISFTGPPEPAASGRALPQTALSAGVSLVLRMEQGISLRESAAGDPIVATLDKAVTSGAVLLPKGTRVLGRIRRLEQYFTSPVSILVGLEFFAAEGPGGRVTFSARLTGPQGTPDVIRMVNNKPEIERGAAGLDIEDDGSGTGVGRFRVAGKELRIERGFRTYWKTQ